MHTALHSRSLAAGYSVDVLRDARVAIVGLGALGQNVTQNLALSGVGTLVLIDFDSFEPHNATRSPFFPSKDEQNRFGLHKAPIVAYGAQRINTMESARTYYGSDTIQRIGNSMVRWADVVVSAVDSTTARAWLAEQCRLLGKPMVEGGFSGAQFNLSAFAPKAAEACYRCAHPDRTSSASCTQYALRAEVEHVVPAIQSTAATLGGLQAEAVMTILHDQDVQYGRRLYGNLRTREFSQATLQSDPMCPGQHESLNLAHPLSLMSSLGELLREMERRAFTHFVPSEPILLTNNCTECRHMCEVGALESTWLLQPRCQLCGGPWPTASDVGSPRSLRVISVIEQSERALCLTLDELGIRDGSVVHALAPSGASVGVPVGSEDRVLDVLSAVPSGSDFES